MIGHVTLTAVDPDRPTSHSRLVVDGIIRKKWNFQGVVMTDDLVMGAVYQHNVCTAVVEALNAGVDLLLAPSTARSFTAFSPVLRKRLRKASLMRQRCVTAKCG